MMQLGITRPRFSGVAIFAAGLALALSAPALAESERGPPKTWSIPDVSSLCGYIRNQEKIPADQNSEYTYIFQAVVYKAAGVTEEDYANASDEFIAAKVSAIWESQIAPLRCGPMGVPATGDPMQYAIHLYFNDFLIEALNLWKIDLSRPTRPMAEGTGTYLDFLDKRIAQNTGELRSRLENYRKSFIELGAKRTSELRVD